MKRLLVVLAGLMLGCCAGSQPHVTPQPIYPAVLYVSSHDFNCVGLQSLNDIGACLNFMTATIGDQGGPTGGTAFWVSEHHVLTAQHVALYAAADPDGRLVAHIGDEQFKKLEVERWIFAGDVDVAIGYVKDPPAHQTLDLCSEIFPGEKATVYGYPGDVGYETATAKVAGTLDSNQLVLLVTSIRGGYSGGPVVSDHRQCVIGVAVQSASKAVQSASKADPPLGIAVSADFLRQFLLAAYEATTP